MKHETNRIGQTEEEPRMAARLSARVNAFMTPRYMHHCVLCGCVLISTSMAFQYFSDLCPKCIKNNRSFQEGN